MNSFVSLSLFPLKLAGYLGIIITFISGVLGLYILLGHYIFHDPFTSGFSGPAQLAILLVFLVGVILICLGLIALYIAHIHGEIVNRPMYVINRRKSKLDNHRNDQI
jgi:dolichol-phosphate mannosyltransferase